MNTGFDLIWRKFELMRIRWRLVTGRAACDISVLPAALDWLDGEIAALNKK